MCWAKGKCSYNIRVRKEFKIIGWLNWLNITHSWRLNISQLSAKYFNIVHVFQIITIIRMTIAIWNSIWCPIKYVDLYMQPSNWKTEPVDKHLKRDIIQKEFKVLFLFFCHSWSISIKKTHSRLSCTNNIWFFFLLPFSLLCFVLLCISCIVPTACNDVMIQLYNNSRFYDTWYERLLVFIWHDVFRPTHVENLTT